VTRYGIGDPEEAGPISGCPQHLTRQQLVVDAVEMLVAQVVGPLPSEKPSAQDRMAARHPSPAKVTEAPKDGATAAEQPQTGHRTPSPALVVGVVLGDLREHRVLCRVVGL
jgi:hypothetical protein